MNRITLVGFLGKEAEVKTTTNNKQYAILSVAYVVDLKAVSILELKYRSGSRHG